MFPFRLRIVLPVLAVIAASILPSHVGGYALNGNKWPDGTQIQMHLGLTLASGPLQDGSASWNASAADALSIWNQYINKVQFVAANPTTPVDGDGVNSVSFSNTIYGQSFGSSTLAVTTHYSTSGVFSETDVIFNTRFKWNSYRGPLQGGGTTGTYDFHRVAVHEFGHVLGLAHPDDYGQSVVAIMNSVTSDLDHLADDDIAGASFLYGLGITSSLTPSSVTVGGNFAYQIVANNSPTSFSATGLPAGLQINPSNGSIYGRPTQIGTFDVTVTAYGSSGNVSAIVHLVILPPVITSSLSPPSVYVGNYFVYAIIASSQANSFDATGLPAGLVLDAANGVINGEPTVSGTFDVTVIAHTPYADATAVIHLNVLPPIITSAGGVSIDIGSQFTYQITATNHSSQFSVGVLPAGLTLNATTGLISGIPTLSGSYNIDLRAMSNLGDAVGTLQLTVNKLPTPPVPAAQFTISSAAGALLASDDARGLVYAICANQLAVIDTKVLAITRTVTLQHNAVTDLSMSPDGSKLWLAYNPIYDPQRFNGQYAFNSLDLETWTLSPDVLINYPADRLRAGLDNRLYISYSSSKLIQVDATTGAVQQDLWDDSYGTLLEMSPDHRTLYAGEERDNPSTLSSFDVSTATPRLLQRVTEFFPYGSDLKVSRDGRMVCLVGGGFSNNATFVRSGADLRKGVTTFAATAPTHIAFSPDNTTAFQSRTATPDIDVFDTKTGNLLQTMHLTDNGPVTGLLVDSSGTYLFVAGNALRLFPLKPASVTGPPKSLLNVSTRLSSQGGDDVLIGGFIVTGSESKKVIVRGIGPSLSLPGKLADPVLELHTFDGKVLPNDNWNEHRADVVASGVAPTDEHEAAIVATLQPGAYTAIVRGLGGTTGIGLVELYDLSPNSSSRIGNISTRGKVEIGDNVMIGGFIIGGNQPTKVIIRAIGPSLAAHGVSGALADTTLELHDGSGALIASNDDWQSDQEQEIIATTIPPTDPRESAIVRTLQPGAYTAIVRGKDNTNGVALVEVYNLDNN